MRWPTFFWAEFELFQEWGSLNGGLILAGLISRLVALANLNEGSTCEPV